MTFVSAVKFILFEFCHNIMHVGNGQERDKELVSWWAGKGLGEI